MIKSLTCPYCSAKMEIKKAECTNCGVVIEGDFQISALSLLSPEQLDFAVTFLKNRGNLKELEDIYNLSYPTLRSRLGDIADVLNGVNTTTKTEKQEVETKMSILKKLESGEIDFDDAMSKLKGLKSWKKKKN